jgi:hypothetical protein
MQYLRYKLAGKTLLEIRGDRHQSLVPPSVHPSGERYRWLVEPREQDVVAAAELQQWVENTLLSFALSLAWNVGARHDLALAFAGWCARRGVAIERALRIIDCAAWAAGDGAVEDRLRAVEDSYEAVSNDEPATGWPTLERLLPAEVARLAGETWKRGRTMERSAQSVCRPQRHGVLAKGG